MRRPLVILAALAVSGCGQGAPPTSTGGVTAVKRDPNRTCSPIVNSREYRTCFSAGAYTRPTIERWTASGWRVVTGPLKPREPSAQWYGGWLSADRRTLLVDWQFPCDSSVALFVPALGGKPRLVTGEKDWAKAPIARSLGWTHDGKARVRLYTSWKRWRITPGHPRLFLFDPREPASDARPVVRSGC